VAGRMRATRPPLLSGSIAVPPAAGLPEAGDFVLAFPPEVLADPARYAVMASLAAEDRVFATGERAARRRLALVNARSIPRCASNLTACGPAGLQLTLVQMY
jgi:hypothetical protein